jgi:hypothetical protein
MTTATTIKETNRKFIFSRVFLEVRIVNIVDTYYLE